MFYKTKITDMVRVSPELLNMDKDARIIKEIKHKYESFVDKDLGIVVDVSKIEKIGEGKIMPGDGAVYYKTDFEILAFKPEIQEVICGKIKDIKDFGAF